MQAATGAPAAPIDQARSILERALPAQGGGTLQDRRDGYEAVLSQFPIPDGTSVTAASYAGVDGFWVRAPEAADDRIGVMLHGGGYIIGSAKGYRAYAADVSRATGARIFVPEYRLAPEHPYPAAIEDAREVLDAAIVEVGPQACFAIGDSAGGGLVISSLWERHRAGASLPASVVLVSPLIDLTVTNPSYDERAHLDPIVTKPGIQRAAGLYLDGRGPSQAPAAFPMLSDLRWFPPCLLLVGTAEVLFDDSRNLAAKLEGEGVDLEYQEYQDMVHVWTLFASFLPEAREAIDRIGTFVRAHAR